VHAIFRYYSGAPDLVDGLVRHSDEVSAALREIEGFRAYYLVRTGADEAISVTVYVSVEQTERSDQVAREWIARELSDRTVGAPNIASGEVAISG
jgi:heme-degrading monooxygenase HmoA